MANSAQVLIACSKIDAKLMTKLRAKLDTSLDWENTQLFDINFPWTGNAKGDLRERLSLVSKDGHFERAVDQTLRFAALAVSR